jgi:Spy/CpxP family protein refolding chaperone
MNAENIYNKSREVFMRQMTKIAGVMIGLAVLSAPLAHADDMDGGKKGGHHDGDWREHHDDMMAKVLGLNQDQVKQLKDLHEKQKASMKGTFEQIKSNREAFEAEIVKAAPDMNKINDLQTQLKTLQGQMADSHLNGLLEVKKIMSPEQFAGYEALRKAKAMMMGRHKFSRHMDGGKKGDGEKHMGGRDGDHDEDAG